MRDIYTENVIVHINIISAGLIKIGNWENILDYGLHRTRYNGHYYIVVKNNNIKFDSAYGNRTIAVSHGGRLRKYYGKTKRVIYRNDGSYDRVYGTCSRNHYKHGDIVATIV